jgi:hypothetical protein
MDEMAIRFLKWVFLIVRGENNLLIFFKDNPGSFHAKKQRLREARRLSVPPLISLALREVYSKI